MAKAESWMNRLATQEKIQQGNEDWGEKNKSTISEKPNESYTNTQQRELFIDLISSIEVKVKNRTLRGQ